MNGQKSISKVNQHEGQESPKRQSKMASHIASLFYSPVTNVTNLWHLKKREEAVKGWVYQMNFLLDLHTSRILAMIKA